MFHRVSLEHEGLRLTLCRTAEEEERQEGNAQPNNEGVDNQTAMGLRLGPPALSFNEISIKERRVNGFAIRRC
jgi:hypothetical protein